MLKVGFSVFFSLIRFIELKSVADESSSDYTDLFKQLLIVDQLEDFTTLGGIQKCNFEKVSCF